MSYNPHAATRAGVILPPSPQVRLVARPATHHARQWDFDLPAQGTWRVRGGAGTGVSSLLIDTVIAQIEAGADPSGILVVAASKESGSLLRRELSERLHDYSAQASMVRSVHSLAFALLRQASPETIRLITGAEQDAVIRELLQGHVVDGRGLWPSEIRPALGYVGFARQLRDFLLRAIERGLAPADLEGLGYEYAQPMWTAAGDFLREYERTQALAGANSYSAAELLNQVLLRPQLTRSHPWHTIIVDDAQLLDPTAGRLIEALVPDARLVVVAGDPDQAVFAFRGASSQFLQDFRAEHELNLTRAWRTPSPACVSIVDSRGTLRDVVADTVRRRHLEDGIAWHEIAVIVRSTGELAAVRRSLLASGVPVHISPTDVVLSQQRLVKAILLALRSLEEELSNTELEELITGPVGGADPVTLRRLIRGLRRWRPQERGITTLREVLRGPLPDFKNLLTERELAILGRVRGVLGAGLEAIEAGASVEEILWAVWQATGLDTRLQASALRGGATGSQADRDLDAIMALFDGAGDFAERRPGAEIASFVRHINEQELPTGVRDRRSAIPEAVEILTAHGAVGREWDTVVVAAPQEGAWPSLGETGSIFGQEDLIDLLDSGIIPGTPVSHGAARLAEERRLFHVATTRHRRRLLIAAVDSPEGDEVEEPSRFIAEFAGAGVDVPGQQARRAAARKLRRTRLSRELGLDVAEPAPIAAREGLEVDPLSVSVLSVPAFVAQLRRVVCNPQAGESEKAQAARQLARMAQAGIPGAHPQQWANARAVASNVALKDKDSLSPSRVEALVNCPLNAMLAGVAESADNPIHLVRGTLAHAFFEALGRGVDKREAFELTLDAYLSVVECPPWQRASEEEAFATLLDRIAVWANETAGVLETRGVEVPVSVRIGEEASIHGYIDRLVQAGEDFVVVDLKTGKTPPSQAQAQDNLQLKTYQLALAHGKWEEGAIVTGPGLPRGGGILVYPGAHTVKVPTREQAAVPPEELEEFAQQLPPLLAQMRGPLLRARENPTCERCRLRTICPVQKEGRLATDAHD